MKRTYELENPFKQVLRQVGWKNLLGLCVGFLWFPVFVRGGYELFVTHKIGGVWTLLYYLIVLIVGSSTFLVQVIMYWTDGRWWGKDRYFHGGFWTHVAKGETGILVGAIMGVVGWLL